MAANMTPEQPGTPHTCNPHKPGKPLPYGRRDPKGKCASCKELDAGRQPRQAPYWVRNRTQRDSGYPTDAERRAHFGPGGPHVAGRCGPVCTFGDY